MIEPHNLQMKEAVEKQWGNGTGFRCVAWHEHDIGGGVYNSFQKFKTVTLCFFYSDGAGL